MDKSIEIKLAEAKSQEEEVEIITAISSISRAEAREQCFKSLAKDKTKRQVRLLLAKLFFDDELYEFSLRELILVKKEKNTDTIDRLIKIICDNTGFKEKDFTSINDESESEKVLAEIEIE